MNCLGWLAFTRTCLAVLAASVAVPAIASAQTVILRGPYLQMPGPDQILVVFHTNDFIIPAVRYSTSVELLDPDVCAEHCAIGEVGSPATGGGFKNVVQLTGLLPNTKYFYTVGSKFLGSLTTPGPDYAFTTSPPHGTVQPIRIWTFGDSGYWPGSGGSSAYLNNRQAYYDYAAGGDVNDAADATDLMLFLGDNAYIAGNDATYHSVFFDPPELQAFLRRQAFFSAAGNHEAMASGFDSIAQTGHYFDMFYFPRANELGINGVASGSEAYYSFDYGNIHFVILDSEQNIANIHAAGAAMLTWLEADLLATSADWIIAAWHRPPYTKGRFHNSDSEANEIAMRTEIVPVLEDYGVDVVLSGHSHSYERSFLLDGHYGASGSLQSAHILNSGDGDPAGDGSYFKASFGQAPHEGTVYIVAGSSADLRSFSPSSGHPAMQKKLVSYGTQVLEVDGDVLVGRFIDENGTIRDLFQIEKGVPVPEPALSARDSMLLMALMLGCRRRLFGSGDPSVCEKDRG